MLNGKSANGAAQIAREWESDRWEGIERPYSAEDVARLRGSIKIEYTLARMGAERLWELMRSRDYVHSGGFDGQSGCAAGQGGVGGDISLWLAGGG
jgi:isocitrate lyase